MSPLEIECTTCGEEDKQDASVQRKIDYYTWFWLFARHRNFDHRYTQKKQATAKKITCKRCPFVLTLRLLSNRLPIVFNNAFALATVSSWKSHKKNTTLSAQLTGAAL
jgi:hypothetical protein